MTNKKKNTVTPMRYGVSLRYGKSIIDAQDCDYDLLGTKNLQIVCLNCGAQLYLSQGGDRRATTRTITNKRTGITKTVDVSKAHVPPHFRHYKDLDNDHLQKCQLRSQGVTTAEVERANRSARGQRERFFKNHFWKAIKFSHLMAHCDEDIKFAEYGLLNLLNKSELVTKHVNKIAEGMASNIHSLLQLAQDTLEHEIVPTIQANPEFLAKLDPSIQSYLSNWNSSLEEKMQIEICQQVIQFLFNKRNLDLTRDLILIAITKTILESIEIDNKPNLFVSDEPVLRPYNQRQWQQSKPVISLWDDSKSREYLQLNPAKANQCFRQYLTNWSVKPNNEAIYNIVVHNFLDIILFCPWSEAYSQLELKESSNNQNYLEILARSKSIGFHHYSGQTNVLVFKPFSDPVFSKYRDLFAYDELEQNNHTSFDLKKIEVFQNTLGNYQVQVEMDLASQTAYFDICLVDKLGETNSIITNGIAWTEKGRQKLDQIFTQLAENYSHQITQLPGSYQKFKVPNKLPLLVSLIAPGIQQMPYEDLKAMAFFGRFEQGMASLLLQKALSSS